MKLLVINSDAMYERRGEFYIHKSTGNLIQNLSNLGLSISLFHFKIKKSSHTISNYRIDTEKIILHKISRSKSKIWSYVRAYITLVKLIRKIDFLYLFYPNAFFYSIFIAKLCGKPYGIYLRGEQNINSKLSKYFYKNAKFVTTISPVFTKLVTDSGGKGFTVKPMIDFDLDDIPQNRKAIKKNFFNILYIGRVEKEKGVFELIESVMILKSKNITNFKLDIVGNGEHFEKIYELINEYKIANLVILHGVITDKEAIRKFYKETDIFILPSQHEGFPRVLYEAMIFRVPIITTFVGSISYLMKDNFNCLEIGVNNPKSIYEKLKYLMNNLELKDELIENATNTIINYLGTNSLSHEQIILNNL